MAHITLTPEVRAALERCTFEGFTVKMPQMERKLYEQVNKVLVNAGGQWKRGAQAHIFNGDPREKLGLVLETGRSVDAQKLFQAYYTPANLAVLVVDETCGGRRLDGLRVLEPSAGGGALADVLRSRGADVTCVELNPEAVAILRGKGHTVIEGDFLAMTLGDLGGAFDIIVMNPPFTRDQDLRHVLHAYGMLQPGGYLGAITAPGWTFGDTTARREFRRWQAQLDAERTEIPEGTFKESGTNIRTILLTLTKPADAPAPIMDIPNFTEAGCHSSTSSEEEEITPATANGQKLDGFDLQTVLDSAANADELGRQQFFTPRDIAAALAVPLSPIRPVFVDLMMGDGALIAGAFDGLPPGHEFETPYRGIGVDIDRRCARQPQDCTAPVATVAADITKLYPLLAELNWQYDLGGFNPPFSMKWFTARLAALADSEVPAVRATFKAGKEHIDSTLATMLIALDRQTEMGEGYLICNESTAIRLFGDPDSSSSVIPHSSLRSHIWAWLTIPPGVFEGVRDFNTAVLYFARGHQGSEPLHLTAPDASAASIRATLQTARAHRGIMRRGRMIHGTSQCSPTCQPLFLAAKQEYLRLHREDGNRQWNLWLQPAGAVGSGEPAVIRRHLTPFQNFSGKIPKPLIATLNDLHGKTPMSLVVQKPSRLALLAAVRSEYWRVEPALLAAVEEACRAYAAERAPFYPLNENQRLGFLDEEDSIVCKKELQAGSAMTNDGMKNDDRSRHSSFSTRHFLPGVSYPLESTTRKIERDFSRPNILGNEEAVTLHGQELVIRVKDESGQWWEFATFNEAELATVETAGDRRGVLKAKLELLGEHFDIPQVPDVAMLHPERYAANLARIDALTGGEPGRAPRRDPASTPGHTAAPTLSVHGAEDGGKLALLQPAKKGKVTPRAYQRDDIARAALHDGLLFGWDKGLGKSLALYLFMQVKGARRVLIVAPEALHEQLIIEGRDKFGVTVRPLESQAGFYADRDLRQANLDFRNGRESSVTGWWITSYTALGFNGGDEWQRMDDDENIIVTPKMRLDRQRDPLWRSEDDERGIGEVRNGIRCVYKPTLSTLVADLFDGVACDEAVRIKSNESYISLGVRQLRPQYRLVLTGTPIKNHLIDIFWLIHWACGGHAEPCARWPYGNANSAKEEFGNTHMFIEENHTREEKAAAVGKRRKFERRIPQICNVHRLWKLLAPAVLYRRKCDIGEAIVPKTIIPIKVKPGTAQHAVYRFHVENKPDFTKQGTPMNPVAQVVSQLTNLRQAALCPHSSNLSSAHIRLHRVREILVEEANRGTHAAKPGGMTAREVRTASLIVAKAASLATLGPDYSQEAKSALEMVERMIAGATPIDLDAIFKAAPNLAPKLRPAVIVETNVKSSRSWTDHNPKQAAILKLIEELIGKGEQVVVMSPFGAFSESLYRRLVEAGVSACLLDGGTTPAKRGIMAGQFKRKKFAVLIGGQKSMGEGHSFECASHLVMPSMDWALDTNSQCEDRVHRLTSPKPVSIYAMVTEGTIDQRLTDLYAEKGDSASLALSAELSAADTGEINLGQLLADAIQNFDPTADTIDELDIEKEWEGGLKGKLRLAELRFREFHPPIVADVTGQRVTPTEIRSAIAAANAPASPNAKPTAPVVAPVVQLVKGIRDATFGALLGTTDPAQIAAGRAAFEAFCADGRHTDWRAAWRAFDARQSKAPQPPKPATQPKAAPTRAARILGSL